MKCNDVGLVEERDFTYAADKPVTLESGHTLGPITIRYETYGEPNADKSNAILLCHALSGDAHAAGYHDLHDRRTGWWDSMVGSGRAFDTDKYWIICSNVLGGCKGTTGPGSTDSSTGEPYGVGFPVITIGDMVDSQRNLIDYLGIDRLYAIAGGSMGGFQVLEWSLRYPERVRSAMCIAASARLTAQAIAFNAVGRHAITSDPGWMDGHYYGTPGPAQGLSIARMVGHITYLSELSMDSKFGRRLQSADRFSYQFGTEFAVESYLQYQGSRFIERFDANSYLYITKAMDYFDISTAYGSLEEAFSRALARYLVISYSSDWLFPTEQSREIVRALLTNDREVSFIEIDAPYGHDSFLIEEEQLTRIIVSFLDCVGRDC